jgi:hypothetical protein
MGILHKRDVEALLADYDHDPVAAVTAALRVVLEQPHADYRALVQSAPFDGVRRIRLLAADLTDLDQLARELNETRTLTAREGS